MSSSDPPEPNPAQPPPPPSRPPHGPAPPAGQPPTSPEQPPPPPGAAPGSDAAGAAPRIALDDRDRELDPRVVQVWRVGTTLALLLPLAVPAVVAPIVLGRWALSLTLALLGLYGAAVGWWPRAKYRRWHWQLTELALELRHGVVVHRHQAVPYFRIQQIDVTQGPLDRLLGLATLQVTTASASGSAALPGLPGPDAPRVRIELLHRASAAVAEHEGELRDAV